MTVVKTYLMLIFFVVHPLDEYYHCTHPFIDSEDKYLICSWEEDDFIDVKRRILKPYDIRDSKLKAKFRRKYVLQH